MKVLVSGTSALIDLRRRGRHLPQKAHRGRPAPRRHQRRVGAGEVDPARAPEHPASLVGAPAPGRGAVGDLRADGGRSLGLPRGVPHRGGPEAGARAAVPPHRGAGPLGEHDQRGAAGTGAGGDPQELAPHLRRQCRASARRRAVRPGQAAGLPRSLRGRRGPAAGSAAPGAGGPCQRPQPGGGAHQQGNDRDPAEVRRPAAGQPGRPGPAGRRPRRR